MVLKEGQGKKIPKTLQNPHDLKGILEGILHKGITKLWNNPHAHKKAQKACKSFFKSGYQQLQLLHYWKAGVINKGVPSDEEHQCVKQLLKNHWSGDSSTATAVGKKGPGALEIHRGFFKPDPSIAMPVHCQVRKATARLYPAKWHLEGTAFVVSPAHDSLGGKCMDHEAACGKLPMHHRTERPGGSGRSAV